MKKGIMFGSQIVFIFCFSMILVFQSSPLLSNSIIHQNDQFDVQAPSNSISSSKVVFGFWPYWTSPSSYTPNWDALSHVAYFSWGANSDGTLTAPTDINRYNTVKSQAQQNGVKIVICITCFTKSTQDSIFAYYKTAFANNVLSLLQTYGAEGVNLDFEFPNSVNSLTSSANSAYIEALISTLYSTLKGYNSAYHISFCIAGSVESAYRNSNNAPYVDAVFLMGYDFHWGSAPGTGAVGPFDDPTQDDVKDGLITLMNYYPAAKVILGAPFYGYDWPCASDQAGATTQGSGTSVLLKNAVVNAQTYGRIWDSNSQTPWYRYQVSTQWHQCWYEDTQSLGIKFDYVNSANLAGTGFWALGYENTDVWTLVLTKFNSSTVPMVLTGKKIALDPGHGGTDPGAEGIDGSGFPNEKDFNLDTALRVKALLEYVGATIIMTRENDSTVSLQERCNIANNAVTDIFVAIHHNSANFTAYGTETFYWAGDDTTYSINGKKLAGYVHNRLVNRLGTNNRGIIGDYPYFEYHLFVLDNTNMPAILPEIAFLSNQNDFDLVSADGNRTKAALAIYEGICDYYTVTPTYDSNILTGYPSSSSTVTRTVNFRKTWTNSDLLTKVYWYHDNIYQGELFHHEWFYDTVPSMVQPVINSYNYSIGTHTVKIVSENLWKNDAETILVLTYQRSPIVGASFSGSTDAYKLGDDVDSDSNYASNSWNIGITIQLPCQFDVWAINSHWWDGDSRYYQYKIEISTDNVNWDLIIDKTSGEYTSWQWDIINEPARYLRITGTYNSANQWYHIKEVHIFTSDDSYVVYGTITRASACTIQDLTQGTATTISVDENGYYSCNLALLNFAYEDQIKVNTTATNQIFTANDPDTSKEVDLVSVIEITTSPISLFSSVLGCIYLLRIKEKTRKKAIYFHLG